MLYAQLEGQENKNGEQLNIEYVLSEKDENTFFSLLRLLFSFLSLMFAVFSPPNCIVPRSTSTQFIIDRFG